MSFAPLLKGFILSILRISPSFHFSQTSLLALPEICQVDPLRAHSACFALCLETSPTVYFSGLSLHIISKWLSHTTLSKIAPLPLNYNGFTLLYFSFWFLSIWHYVYYIFGHIFNIYSLHDKDTNSMQVEILTVFFMSVFLVFAVVLGIWGFKKYVEWKNECILNFKLFESSE